MSHIAFLRCIPWLRCLQRSRSMSLVVVASLLTAACGPAGLVGQSPTTLASLPAQQASASTGAGIAPTSRPLDIVFPVPEVMTNPSVQRLLAALARHGVTPTPNAPSALRFFGNTTGQAYVIGVPQETTGGYLFIHVYPDAAAVAAMIAQLPATIYRDGVPTWANQPHFFHYETSIVLLLSQDPMLVQALVDVGAIPFTLDDIPVPAPSTTAGADQRTSQLP